MIQGTQLKEIRQAVTKVLFIICCHLQFKDIIHVPFIFFFFFSSLFFPLFLNTSVQQLLSWACTWQGVRCDANVMQDVRISSWRESIHRGGLMKVSVWVVWGRGSCARTAQHSMSRYKTVKKHVCLWGGRSRWQQREISFIQRYRVCVWVLGTKYISLSDSGIQIWKWIK